MSAVADQAGAGQAAWIPIFGRYSKMSALADDIDDIRVLVEFPLGMYS